MEEQEQDNTERFSEKAKKIFKLVAIIVGVLFLFGIITKLSSGNNTEPQLEEPKKSSEEPDHSTTLSFAKGKKGVIEEEKTEDLKGIVPSEEDIKKEEKKETLPPPESTESEKPPMLTGPVPVQVQPQEQAVSPEEQWRLDTINQIRQRRRQQFFEATLATISVNGMQTVQSSNGGVSNGIGNYDPDNPNSISAEQDRVRAEIARTEAQLASLQGNSAGSGGSSSTTVLDVSDYNGEAVGSSSSGSGSYSTMANKDGWSLNNSLQPLSNPYSVLAGAVMPAVMISGVNSDLPGQIMGQVSQNVYDTATGYHLLIPQGTRIVGTYGSSTSYGQERIMIAWQRLIYPDGRTLDLGTMPGSDPSGYSGFTDQINNHWWKLMSSAFLMSGIVAAVSVSVDDKSNNNNNNSNSTNMTDTMRTALATQFGTVIAQVIQRNLSVSPTLEIRPGYKFNVVVTKDIKFDKPYELFN